MKALMTFFSITVLWTSAFGQVLDVDSNLFNAANSDIRGKSKKEIHRDNLATIQTFIDFDVDTHEDNSYMRAKSISREVAEDVKRAIMLNPVVSSSVYHKYDPENKGIGFCFGRAMFANIDLAYRELDRDSMKKAFVVGSMSTGSGSWGWHVTTIAQSKDEKGQEQWLAIDPITGVVTLEQWYQIMYDDFSTDQKLKLYVTESGKFGPAPSQYHEQEMQNQYYNQYFTDMMDWFKVQAKNDNYDDKILPKHK